MINSLSCRVVGLREGDVRDGRVGFGRVLRPELDDGSMHTLQYRFHNNYFNSTVSFRDLDRK
jgi:hypothetical protein